MMQSNKYGSQHDYMTDDQVLAACKKYLGTSTIEEEPTIKEEPKTNVSHKMVSKWKSFFRKQTNSIRSVFGGYKLRLLKAQDKSQKCLIGIGGGGSNILSDIQSINNIHKFIHINSDHNALVQKDSEYKILLTSDGKNNKWGCGGNTECGVSLIDDKTQETLKQYIEGYKKIHVIAALGGGVGSGSTPEVLKYLQELGKQVIVYVTLPFAFEGKARMAVANDSMKQIKPYAYKLEVVENNDVLKRKQGMRESLKSLSIQVYSLLVKNKKLLS